MQLVAQNEPNHSGFEWDWLEVRRIPTCRGAVAVGMSPTVHDLRNGIRAAVGRFECEVDAQFTKEELAAIADEVGYAVEGSAPA
jgi:hypothetical protein